MLQFKECQIKGYRQRTSENASADVTLAFAVDFLTPGERLTFSEVIKQDKLYIPIDLTNPKNLTQDSVDKVAEEINRLNKKEISLNIAGNSIKRFNYPQEELDKIVYNFLHELHNNDIAEFKITLIRSGGQTGSDEAGIKAAIKLDIPSLIYAPKGWVFRDKSGKDIEDEQLFKKTFC